jgi:hypothetical protein
MLVTPLMAQSCAGRRAHAHRAPANMARAAARSGSGAPVSAGEPRKTSSSRARRSGSPSPRTNDTIAASPINQRVSGDSCVRSHTYAPRAIVCRLRPTAHSALRLDRGPVRLVQLRDTAHVHQQHVCLRAKQPAKFQISRAPRERAARHLKEHFRLPAAVESGTGTGQHRAAPRPPLRARHRDPNH